MPRNCLFAIAVWIALFAGYSFYLYTLRLPVEGALLGGTMMACLVGLGVLMIRAAHHAGTDRRALERFQRGERPQDGEIAAVVGEVRPAFEPLLAPLSGRECVVYRYDIGPPRGTADAARDYIGFAFTRCAVHTPYGTYALGVFPVLNGFAEEPGEPARAREYVAATQFEDVSSVVTIAKYTLELHHQPPPLRIDWQLGQVRGNAEESKEVVVPSGATVTAYGLYSSATNSLTSGTKHQGYLRVYAGGGVSIPSGELGHWIAGTILIVVANAGMLLVLGKLSSL